MIIATAGHVDHGKTALVRNLTGIETDRLKEEQRRGLSINLGYAYQQLPNGKALGFIDVPGHRRFINTMISGVSGIDLGMLVVAADDGPMPQTREHVDVMQLLGVRDYVLVVSKCDRCDEQRVLEACREAAAMLPSDTAIFKISNVTGEGIAELRSALEERALQLASRAVEGHFRMSIDRSFSLQGQGLILTGTIASGRVALGDTVLLQPQGTPLRVRGIHTQDAPAPEGYAGERCALNVSGEVHKDNIDRGDWVVSPSGIGTTSRIDVRIRMLPAAPFPLKHLSTIKLHIGAKHLEASLMLLHQGENPATRLHPGESALAQIWTARPIHCCHGDRFLLRDYGETATLGGGVVLDPIGPKRHRASPTRFGYLLAQEQSDIESAIRQSLLDESWEIDYGALRLAWNIATDQKAESFTRDIKSVVTDRGEFLVAAAHWKRLKQRILDALHAFHKMHPAEPGIAAPDLMRTSLPSEKQHYFRAVLESLTDANAISLINGAFCIKGHGATSSDPDNDDWTKISACLDKHGLQIPTVSDLQTACGFSERDVKRILARAQKDRLAIRINPKRYATLPIMSEYSQAVMALTQEKPILTLAEYRDHLKVGRNLALEVLEYFDGVRFTKREGNGRRVLNAALPDKLFNVRQRA